MSDAPLAEIEELYRAEYRRFLRVALAVLRVGRRMHGYRCWRVDFSTGQSRGSCPGPEFTAPSIWPELVQPAGGDLFVIGHTFGPIARVQLEFPNRDWRRTRPVDGLFVIAVPKSYLTTERQTAFVRGYAKTGRVIQRQGSCSRCGASARRRARARRSRSCRAGSTRTRVRA
jgi:hypothetical protein